MKSIVTAPVSMSATSRRGDAIDLGNNIASANDAGHPQAAQFDDVVMCQVAHASAGIAGVTQVEGDLRGRVAAARRRLSRSPT